jgi:hypothetical protein
MQSIRVGEYDGLDDLGKSFFSKIGKFLKKLDPIQQLRKVVAPPKKLKSSAAAPPPMVATPVPPNVTPPGYQTWSITGTDGNGAPVNYSFADQASAEAYGNQVLANGGNVTLNPPGGGPAIPTLPMSTVPPGGAYPPQQYPTQGPIGPTGPSSNYYPAPPGAPEEGPPPEEPLPELAPEPTSSKDRPLPPEPQDGGEEENPDQEEGGAPAGAKAKGAAKVPAVPAPMIKAAEAPPEGMSPIAIAVVLAAVGGIGYYFYNKNKGGATDKVSKRKGSK